MRETQLLQTALIYRIATARKLRRSYYELYTAAVAKEIDVDAAVVTFFYGIFTLKG